MEETKDQRHIQYYVVNAVILPPPTEPKTDPGKKVVLKSVADVSNILDAISESISERTTLDLYIFNMTFNTNFLIEFRDNKRVEDICNGIHDICLRKEIDMEDFNVNVTYISRVIEPINFKNESDIRGMHQNILNFYQRSYVNIYKMYVKDDISKVYYAALEESRPCNREVLGKLSSLEDVKLVNVTYTPGFNSWDSIDAR